MTDSNITRKRVGDSQSTPLSPLGECGERANPPTFDSSTADLHPLSSAALPPYTNRGVTFDFTPPEINLKWVGGIK